MSAHAFPFQSPKAQTLPRRVEWWVPVTGKSRAPTIRWEPPGSTIHHSKIAPIDQIRRVDREDRGVETENAPAEERAAISIAWSRVDGLRIVTVLGVLGLAAALTMALFGLPPIDLHGPLHRMGIMDPLCGGTRAARLTAQGNLAGAWKYNPLGILATFAAAAALARLMIGVVGRRWLNVHVAWTPRRMRIALTVLVVALVILEIRQQGRADLLLKPY